MKNRPLQAAVVGAGQIAKQHLGALATLDRVETVGICDLSPIMAESTADRYAIKRWFTDFQELLGQQPDVVHICTGGDKAFNRIGVVGGAFPV